MQHQIGIVEVAARDGLQNEPEPVATAMKAELITRLMAAGIRRIEVASFVSPARVPQMADAEQLLAMLPRSPEVSFIGLVLNRRGLDRAVAAGCHEVGMVISASDVFNQRNQGATTDESIAEWLDISRAAAEAGVRADITIATAFGCPFEGEVPLRRVLEIARRVAEGGPREIAFADTIGVGVPRQVTELLSSVRSLLPHVALRCHFHNTRNTGIANAHAAIEAGASTLDSSVGGIGGCPFAPGATGNIATEDLVYMLERSSISSGVNLDALLGTARWLQERLGRPVPGALSKVAAFPRGTAE
jgi:hydroxymethylglutaryl-CoA lyase